MTRNQIIRRVAELTDDNQRLTIRTPELEGQLATLRLFSNDLCNSPTKWNRNKGARVYTVKEAEKRLRGLTPKLPRYFEDGAFVERILNP